MREFRNFKLSNFRLACYLGVLLLVVLAVQQMTFVVFPRQIVYMHADQFSVVTILRFRTYWDWRPTLMSLAGLLAIILAIDFVRRAKMSLIFSAAAIISSTLSFFITILFPYTQAPDSIGWFAIPWMTMDMTTRSTERWHSNRLAKQLFLDYLFVYALFVEIYVVGIVSYGCLLLRAASKLIREGKVCFCCGYNLRGLDSRCSCPECGNTILGKSIS